MTKQNYTTPKGQMLQTLAGTNWENLYLLALDVVNMEQHQDFSELENSVAMLTHNLQRIDDLLVQGFIDFKRENFFTCLFERRMMNLVVALSEIRYAVLYDITSINSEANEFFQDMDIRLDNIISELKPYVDKYLIVVAQYSTE